MVVATVGCTGISVSIIIPVILKRSLIDLIYFFSEGGWDRLYSFERACAYVCTVCVVELGGRARERQ